MDTRGCMSPSVPYRGNRHDDRTHWQSRV